MSQSNLITLFLDLRSCVKIAHHIPGRLRLRVSLGAIKKAVDLDMKSVEAMLQKLPGVRDVRLNKIAGTAVISYDAKMTKPDYWAFLLEGAPDAVEADLTKKFDAVEA